jgi:outer membrane PBP1 activator LpoA protein
MKILRRSLIRMTGLIVAHPGLWLAAGVKAQTVAVPQIASPTPIAVLLPLKSADFGRAAEAVRSGLLKAREVMASPVELKFYDSDGTGDSAVAAFQQAQAAGARFIIGPLTRREVTAVAALGTPAVPTLALNSLDPGMATPARFWTYALTIESEARQMAQLAWQEGRRNENNLVAGRSRSAIIVQSATGLGRRAAQSFAEAFRAEGGQIVLQLDAGAADLRQKLSEQTGGIIFLATEAGVARELRPFLQRFSLYGTSLLFEGRQLRWQDLDGVKFVDQPWMLQPDHAAVMVFPRAETLYAPELERLYALGIDALRLALELMRNPDAAFELDGVTGILRFHNGRIERRATLAWFRDGEAVME